MVQTTSRLDRFLYELAETRGFVNSSEGVVIAYSRFPWDSVLVLSGVISRKTVASFRVSVRSKGWDKAVDNAEGVDEELVSLNLDLR